MPASTKVRDGEAKSLVEISPGLMETCTRIVVNGMEVGR